ncbi:MAG: hypothetical protein LC641_05625 [Spirochaeta sp.]|nr:hypothetical protein [Spirochaeta sp.]
MDNGLYQVIRTKPDREQLWENACFLELLRKGKKPDFWLENKGEIDFVMDSELIQVCLDLHEGNEVREKSSLVRAMNRMPDRKPVIWTREQSRTREQSGEEDPETGIMLRSGLIPLETKIEHGVSLLTCRKLTRL